MVLELLFEYGEHESSSVAQILNVVQLDSLTVESLWLMVKHRSAEIGRFEVQFPIGVRNFYFVPRSWQDEKITLSIILPSAKLTIPLVLFRDISLF